MKKIIGLVTILAVALLGGYYITGVLTEKTLKKNIATINDPNGLGTNFTEYQRGWFKSTAVLDATLHIPARTVKNAQGQPEIIAEQNLHLPIPMTINHGPIIIADDGIHFGIGYARSVITIPADYQAQFDAMFAPSSEKPKFDISIFVNYLTRSTVQFGVPPFKAITKENNINFDWKGIESASVLSPNMDKLIGNLDFNGVHTFKAKEFDVDLGEVDIEYDMKKVASGIFLGPASFYLDSFVMTVKGEKTFQISDLSIKNDSGIKDGLFYAKLDFSLDKIDSKEKSYGPGEFSITIKNLDAPALLKIHQQAMAMQQAEESQRQQYAMSMIPELPALLSKGPELEVSKFEFTMPEGSIEGHLKFSIPKEENSNPLQMMQKLEGDGKISMPVAVLKMLMTQSVKQKLAAQPNTEQALMEQLQKDGTASADSAKTTEQQAATTVDSRIANLVKSGAIVQDGTNYLIEFELKEGKLTVNGKPFSPAMMQY